MSVRCGRLLAGVLLLKGSEASIGVAQDGRRKGCVTYIAVIAACRYDRTSRRLVDVDTMFVAVAGH